MPLRNPDSLSQSGKAQPNPARFTRVETVYCPMCTHTVQADVVFKGKRVVVAEGQRCPNCHSALDAGYVMRTERAA